MKYASGVRKYLTNRRFDPEVVSLVLERLEDAVPHLYFEKWEVYEHLEDDEGIPDGEVLWKNQSRCEIEVSLYVQKNVCISSICARDQGAIHKDDYEFLLELASEAAGLVHSSLVGTMSLFEFGNLAVAAEIERRAELDINPIAIIRFVRSLAQETYENKRLSYGLILTRDYIGDDPMAEAFDNKRLKYLTDGFSTSLVVDSKGNIAGYVALVAPENEGTRSAKRPWWSAGLAERSLEMSGAGVALVRNGDMLVLHNGRMIFNQRAGRWRIWNHAAIIFRLKAAWQGLGRRGNLDEVLVYLYHVALDLSFRRSGGLLVVVPNAQRFFRLLMSTSDRVGAKIRGAAERAMDEVLRDRLVQRIDRRIMTDLASLDGALVVDRTGHVLAYGAMTHTAGGARQGARTRAAVSASRGGIAIKISSDGNISFFAEGNSFMEL